MTYRVKVILFFAVLLVGAAMLHSVGRILAFILVAITGWGWLFGTLGWILIVLFWALMFWKFWPRKLGE